MIVFIKRECVRHPGCFTMSDKCDRCHEQDIRDRFRRELHASPSEETP